MPDTKRIGLEVDSLTVCFGGAVAVDGLSLRVPPRSIVGLIGPNGAGKTTTFDACCGLLRPTRGSIRLDGRDVTTMPPQQRARLGLGRTFQRMELFSSLTVAENVALGREALLSAGQPWRHLHCSAAERNDIDVATEEALGLCGLSSLATALVDSLSTGQRRMTELARGIAGGFRILLLDEPSSGLDVAETEALGRILEALVNQRGVGILLVEHDMSLVLSVCSQLYVIDFGSRIFEGTADDARRSEVVRAAYLGEAA